MSLSMTSWPPPDTNTSGRTPTITAGRTPIRGIGVSERLVWWLMHDAGIHGLSGPVKTKRVKGIPTVDDLVVRRFARSRLNEFWVSDITEHPTREGKVFCCCVMDTCSRRTVGWSIGTVQDSQLVIKALDMTITQCTVNLGGIVHVDRGVQSVHVLGLHREGPRRRPHALVRFCRPRVR